MDGLTRALLIVALLMWGFAHVIKVSPRRLPVPAWRVAMARIWRARSRRQVDVGALITEVATRLRSGAGAAEAWDGAAARAGLPTGMVDGLPAALAALPAGPAGAGARAAWRMAAELGAPLAETLDDCATALSHVEENAASRSVALAGPLASARLLAALPVLGVLLGTGLGADPLKQLLGGGVGTGAGVLGAVLYAAGLRWSGRLVRAARGTEA
ncbi:MAG TPA: hypothetical protein VFC82_02150 [Actinomycetaceae bacterium]|nr:hypothetical protein [Actinomycetaceae bacterium]